jgi:chromosome segregation ATPase
VADPIATTGGTSSISGAAKIPLLFGTVLALFGASIYAFYQLRQLGMELEQVRKEEVQVRRELTGMRDQLSAEIGRLRVNSTVSTETNRTTVGSLKAELEVAQRQARMLAGKAKEDATKYFDEVALKFKKAQEDEARTVAAMKDEMSQVKNDSDSTKTRVGEMSSEVGTVKTELSATKSELENTIADLKSTKGDLGVWSSKIATNEKELAALKSVGERDYTNFKLAKERIPRKVGALQIRLKSTDPKKNHYTVEVIADDKVIDKKDKSVNEPVQFLLSRSRVPYELIVYEVKKDMIIGYIAEPKAQVPRN